MKINIPVGSN